jgi:dTDP-4-amino-4,6-dideoxygalactose transaminase
MRVALFDTETPIAPLRAEIQARVAAVIEQGRFILGPEVAAFESELAAYLGVRHVIGVANGTDAITIALRALGVRAGQEVVVPSFTFYATAEAVASAVAVDLFGCPAPCAELRKLGVPVLEDAAQAAGARLHGRHAGALGDAATFSFFPSKNLGCFGDGGAIATDSDEVAELSRALRFHGSRDKQHFQYVGYNSRLDELQAAILRVLLPSLDGWCDGRRAAADAYAAAGLGAHVGLPHVCDGADPAWHLYVVTHPRPDALIAGLAEQGVQARGYYRIPLHRQPAMAPYARASSELPVTDALAAGNVALPMSPVLTPAQAQTVVEAVGAVLAVA